MSEKMTGYVLLIGGIGIMLFSVVYVILVFTNKIAPLPIFSLQSTQTATSDSTDISDILQQLQTEGAGDIAKSLGQQGSNLPMPKVDLIPPKTLNQMLNMTTTFFLMSFLLGFGGKIANLGIMMLRPIVVKLKTKEGEIINNVYGASGQNEIPQKPNVTVA